MNFFIIRAAYFSGKEEEEEETGAHFYNNVLQGEKRRTKKQASSTGLQIGQPSNAPEEEGKSLVYFLRGEKAGGQLGGSREGGRKKRLQNPPSSSWLNRAQHIFGPLARSGRRQRIFVLYARSLGRSCRVKRRVFAERERGKRIHSQTRLFPPPPPQKRLGERGGGERLGMESEA